MLSCSWAKCLLLCIGYRKAFFLKILNYENFSEGKISSICWVLGQVNLICGKMHLSENLILLLLRLFKILLLNLTGLHTFRFNKKTQSVLLGIHCSDRVKEGGEDLSCNNFSPFSSQYL